MQEDWNDEFTACPEGRTPFRGGSLSPLPLAKNFLPVFLGSSLSGFQSLSLLLPRDPLWIGFDLVPDREHAAHAQLLLDYQEPCGSQGPV
jgi:hypothetical protein